MKNPKFKTVAAIGEALGISENEAIDVLMKAQAYTTAGKGVVLTDTKQANFVGELLLERSVWLSAELNAKVGWQFSQAVYALRKAGWNIRTLALGGRQYAYQLVEAGRFL